MLMIVTESIGSSPGKAGFKMAVASDSSIIGSIGGGVMEYQMVELARRAMGSSALRPFLMRQVHTRDAAEDKSGMVCSGEQTLVFIPMNGSHLNAVGQFAELLYAGGQGEIYVSEAGVELRGLRPGCAPLPLRFEKNADAWSYREQVGYRETVYIFGAGHISVPLSQVLSLMNFRVEVFDNRRQLSTFEANTYAHRKRIVDYTDVTHLVASGNSSYVAIMTFGHEFDEIVLRQLLSKELRYLGMIGSKSKARAMLERLVREGFAQDQVDRVCSPIGLPVGGQTPAEIAVSIAAQILQYRYR